eukprot:c18970_g1_i1.p1 GENE.c18970_g1_i1~~c18970_g1_i1.p1  ORF type:complete len:352 (+),score=178.75 c18970_g1_i1:49-1104(+)
MANKVEKKSLNLNASFEQFPIANFPAPTNGVIIIDSDTSVSEAAKILAQAKILSAPVRDKNASADSRWSEKYIGIVDMVSLVHFVVEEALKRGDKGNDTSPEAFETILQEIEVLRHTPVSRATRAAKFGPLIPLEEKESTLLDAMLIMGKYGIHRIPIVSFAVGDIVNFITQSAVVGKISEACKAQNKSFNETLAELGLAKLKDVARVHTEQPLLSAFLLIIEHHVTAVPVVDNFGHIIGNISASDVHSLVSEPHLFVQTTRSYMTVGAFLEWRSQRENNVKAPITFKPESTLQSVMDCMVTQKIHRVYVVDDLNRPIGVVSLTDVIDVMVVEPENYFNEFFVQNDPEYRS